MFLCEIDFWVEDVLLEDSSLGDMLVKQRSSKSSSAEKAIAPQSSTIITTTKWSRNLTVFIKAWHGWNFPLEEEVANSFPCCSLMLFPSSNITDLSTLPPFLKFYIRKAHLFLLSMFWKTSVNGGPAVRDLLSLPTFSCNLIGEEIRDVWNSTFTYM